MHLADRKAEEIPKAFLNLPKHAIAYQVMAAAVAPHTRVNPVEIVDAITRSPNDSVKFPPMLARRGLQGRRRDRVARGPAVLRSGAA